MNEQTPARVRFAPSPTGYLHIGGARTCLFNWLYARSKGAQFILRIEDTDLERSSNEFLDEILESITWLGMDYDEIHHQSKRFDIYREYASQLIKSGQAYEKEGAVFFRYAFDEVVIDDAIRGEIVFKELPKDEEVIIKSDGSPTYNFSCAVDDGLMNINFVIRGEDHISNTPKQILMYEALGLSVPRFAHVPLILSPQGGRLSKRFGATSIREYREKGYLAQALSNYLLLLGWSPKQDRELLSLAEAAKLFSIKDVNTTGAVFSLDKLNWINGEYIRSMDIDTLSNAIKSHFAGDLSLSENDFTKLVSLFQVRINTLSEFKDVITPFIIDEVEINEEARVSLAVNYSKEIKLLMESLMALQEFDAQHIEEVFRKTAVDLGLKLKGLVAPVRAGLTGKKHGAGLFETVEVLGKERSIKRLEKLCQLWDKSCD